MAEVSTPTSASSSSSAFSSSPFSLLSDDILLNIFLNLEPDPRDWARLACVSARFSALIRNVCCMSKCSRSIPSVVNDLLSSSSQPDPHPPGGWSAFHKLSVCCPGLLHAGVLLENSDFGLEREIGPDENYRCTDPASSSSSSPSPVESTASAAIAQPPPAPSAAPSDGGWSLYDDLYFDTVYDPSESHITTMEREEPERPGPDASEWEFSKKRKTQNSGSGKAHLAVAAWNLSREQGNKLLASRFRGDILYICDWPGCVHAEEKRNYMLFRGVFKNFKRSKVWRTIKDGNRSKIDLDCPFCPCKETWDLHSAFCLRRVFGYHDDGEPVVRAYVCENGHVSVRTPLTQREPTQKRRYLEERVYVEQPSGCNRKGEEDKVCKLKKALYGLKQV